MSSRDKVSAFLQTHAGFYFCSFCVSRELQIDSFTGRDAVSELQASPGYDMRTAECVSCAHPQQVIAAISGFALLGPEAHVVSFLLTNKGFAFCNACLALANELSRYEAHRAVRYVQPLPEFEHLEAGECSVCTRPRPVISALASTGETSTPTRTLYGLIAPGSPVRHRGWRIDVLSYRVGAGWRPFIVIHGPAKAAVPEAATLWEPMATKAEADAFGLAQAQEWIDKRY